MKFHLLATMGLVCGTACTAIEDTGELALPSEAQANALGWSILDFGGASRPTLRLDLAGNPALSYARGVPQPHVFTGDRTPVFASNDGGWRAGTGWHTEDVALTPGNIDGFSSSLAFVDTAQVAFTSRVRLDSNSGYTLRLAHKTAGAWQVATIEPAPWVYQMVERADAGTGTTYLLYHSTAQPGVVVARGRTSGPWTKTVVPIVLNLLSSLDATVTPAAPGSKDPPVVSIATTTLLASTVPPAPRGLHFATSTDGGVTWGAVEHVDTTSAMIGPQLAQGAKTTAIAYTDVNNRSLKLATRLDGIPGWTIETVGAFPVSPASGITLDANGAPLLVFTSDNTAAGRDELYFARRAPSGVGWQLELVDTISHVGGQGLAVNPRIALTADNRVVIAYQYGTFDIGRVRVAWSSPI